MPKIKIMRPDSLYLGVKYNCLKCEQDATHMSGVDEDGYSVLKDEDGFIHINLKAGYENVVVPLHIPDCQICKKEGTMIRGGFTMVVHPDKAEE